jgi:ankyrin repeat protein
LSVVEKVDSLVTASFHFLVSEQAENKRMASMMTKEEEFQLARKLQDLFKEAVQSCMDGHLAQFQQVLEKLIATENFHGSTEDFICDFHSEGRTLFHVACSSGRTEMVEFLLSKVQNSSKFVNLKDQRGFTPLINATISESIDIMKRLVHLGADVNARNDDGATAVHFAAGDGNIERVRFLQESGAILIYKSASGTPLHWAASKGHSFVVQFLIQNGCNANDPSQDGIPPIFLAAVAGSDATVVHFVDAKADLGTIVSGNLTVLHICAEHGLTESVYAIIQQETGLKCCNLPTDDGNLPIHLAAMSNHVEIMKALLPVTDLSIYSIPSGDEESTIAWLVEDGKQRLAAWERKHGHSSQEGGDKDNKKALLEGMPASMQLFESLPEPNKSLPNFEQQADEWKDLGNKAFQKQSNIEAIQCYTKAIELNKYNHTYWSNRSVTYYHLQDYEHSLIDAEVCRRLKPDWSKGCYRLALARLALKQFEDAALAAFEGCKIDPNNQELKTLLQNAVKKGQEEFQQKNSTNNK